MHYTVGSLWLYNANIFLCYSTLDVPNILENKYCDPQSLKTLLKFFWLKKPKPVFNYKIKVTSKQRLGVK